MRTVLEEEGVKRGLPWFDCYAKALDGGQGQEGEAAFHADGFRRITVVAFALCPVF